LYKRVRLHDKLKGSVFPFSSALTSNSISEDSKSCVFDVFSWVNSIHHWIVDFSSNSTIKEKSEV
jgi:hypothetical protein